MHLDYDVPGLLLPEFLFTFQNQAYETFPVYLQLQLLFLFIICWLEGHPVIINDPAFPAVTSSKFIPLAVAKQPCDKTIKSFDTTPQLGDVHTS